MAVIPESRKVSIQPSGERQRQVFPIPMIRRGHNGGTGRRDQIIECLGEDPRSIQMFNNFEADDDREPPIGLGKCFVC